MDPESERPDGRRLSLLPAPGKLGIWDQAGVGILNTNLP